MLSIVAQQSYSEEDILGYAVKLTGDEYELNIFLTREELPKFAEIPNTRWEDRNTPQIGRSAGSKVYWAHEGARCHILVGHDDETWDFGVDVSSDVYEQILKAIAEEDAERSVEPSPND